MNQQLRSGVPDPGHDVRIDVSQQKHELEEENAGGPDGGRSTQIRQQHFADHRLTNEKEERTGKERPSRNENTKSIGQLLMEPCNQ